MRYWAAGARLGTDTAFDEKVLKIGQRLVTKLFNAGKFVLAQDGDVAPISAELDRAFVHRLRDLVERVTAALDDFDYAHALQQTESFFWRDFTDTYLELVKGRARDGTGPSPARRSPALRLGLSVLLRLFAPVLPYITEEVWSWVFAAETGHASIHRAPWPGAADFAGIEAPADPQTFDVAVSTFAAINKGKSQAQASIGRGVDRLVLGAGPATLERFALVRDDVLAAARVAAAEVEARPDVADGTVDVLELELAPVAEASA